MPEAERVPELVSEDAPQIERARGAVEREAKVDAVDVDVGVAIAAARVGVDDRLRDGARHELRGPRVVVEEHDVDAVVGGDRGALAVVARAPRRARGPRPGP